MALSRHPTTQGMLCPSPQCSPMRHAERGDAAGVRLTSSQRTVPCIAWGCRQVGLAYCTVFHLPWGCLPPSTLVAACPTLPARDPTQRQPYYFNAVTRQSQWHMPSVFLEVRGMEGRFLPSRSPDAVIPPIPCSHTPPRSPDPGVAPTRRVYHLCVELYMLVTGGGRSAAGGSHVVRGEHCVWVVDQPLTHPLTHSFCVPWAYRCTHECPT